MQAQWRGYGGEILLGLVRLEVGEAIVVPGQAAGIGIVVAHPHLRRQRRHQFANVTHRW